MTEYSWDDVEEAEEITEDDFKQSEDISKKHLVGKFVCTVKEVKPVQKDFNDYSCMAASMVFRVDEVLEFDQPILNEKGEEIKHPQTGEIVSKKQAVSEKLKESLDAEMSGQVLFDDILLHSPDEKPNTKKRRLFIARKFGLIDHNSNALPGARWADTEGKKIIIETEWNSYTKKGTTDVIKNAKVMWDGYEKYEAVETEADLSGI